MQQQEVNLNFQKHSHHLRKQQFSGWAEDWYSDLIIPNILWWLYGPFHQKWCQNQQNKIIKKSQSIPLPVHQAYGIFQLNKSRTEM